MKKTVLAVVIPSILVLFYESANKTMADYAEAKSKEAIVHLESDAKNFTSKDILFTLHSVNGAGSAQAKNSWLIIGFSIFNLFACGYLFFKIKPSNKA